MVCSFVGNALKYENVLNVCLPWNWKIIFHDFYVSLFIIISWTSRYFTRDIKHLYTHMFNGVYENQKIFVLKFHTVIEFQGEAVKISLEVNWIFTAYSFFFFYVYFFCDILNSLFHIDFMMFHCVALYVSCIFVQMVKYEWKMGKMDKSENDCWN